MRGRWGLQAKMTASYVAVTAGAVLVTELVIFVAAVLSPPVRLSAQALRARALTAATALAWKLSAEVAATGRLPATTLGTLGLAVTPGQAQPATGGGVLIPQTSTPGCDLAPASFAVVLSRDGTVLATSYPACYPAGSRGTAAGAAAVRPVLASFRGRAASSGVTQLPSGKVLWAAAPVVATPAGSKAAPGTAAPGTAAPGTAAPGTAASTGPAGKATGKLFGTLYLEIPPTAPPAGGVTVSPSLIRTGMLMLAVAIPAGIAFGLLSTRRLTRRLRRLAASTLEIADGGFDRRLPVSGTDEVAHLEENFNRMAGRLQESLDARRRLAEANARHQERSRIARELHDSISQELFSLSVLAGGLRRALPPGSAVLTEVETMERTAGDTMREMQSLLLALRPVALDEVGLASAIDGICGAYRQRLGVQVLAELESLVLPPELEHAILRVTQEALANAVRHAGAATIVVRLRAGQDEVLLDVTDDGRGLGADTLAESGAGLGLPAMRDRVAEQGGQLAIDSTPGAGTRVRARFPWRPG